MDWGYCCGGPFFWIFPLFCLAMIGFCIFGGSRCFPRQREERREDEIKELKREIAELKEMMKEMKEK